MSPHLPPLVPTTVTRTTLHNVAETVLAAEQHAAIGKLGLFVTPNGFGTRWFAQDGGADRRIRIEGAEIVRESRDAVTDRTPIDGALDAAAEAVLIAWWAFGDAVLTTLSPAAGEEISGVTLWPEHFDIAVTVTLAADSVNLGFSPGDDFCEEPYVYAGPWTARTGDFWNASFGAYRTYSEIAEDPGMAEHFLKNALDEVRAS